MPGSPQSRLRDAGFFAALLCLLGVLYWPALHGGLLWDDAAHVTAPALRSVHGLRLIWFHLGATQQYYPLLHSAFWIEHRLWGDATVGYHGINLGWHALAAALLAGVLRRLEVPGARLAALLFAVHPVCVGSVAWISEQKNGLSLVFYLLAARAYLAFDENRRPRTYAAALLCFVLALLTKSVVATLPAALLVVLWWKRGRVHLKHDALPLLPWLVIGAGMGLFTAWVERTIVGAQGADYALTAVARILLAAHALIFYAGKLLWPAHLAFMYSRWTIDPHAAGAHGYLLLCLLGFAGLAAWLPRRRGPLACGLLFAGTLFPAMGFFNVYPFAYSWVADHFQYHASLAVFAAAGYLATAAAAATRGAAAAALRWLPAAAIAVATLGLGIATRREAATYASAETLYRVTLQRTPDCSLAHNNLAVLLAQRGEAGAALAEYDAALRAKPNYAVAWRNRGNVLAEMAGRWPEAERSYRQAIALRPADAQTHDDLAIGLARQPGRETEALREYETAIALAPGDAEARANYAQELARRPERHADALAAFTAALALAPADAALRYNYGNELAKDPARLAAAIGAYQAALRLQPDYPEAHNNLAIAYANVGRIAEAKAELRAALERHPEFSDARRNLAALEAAAN